MKLIFSHQNPMIVGNARGIVEAAGIAVTTRNEYAQGGVGELATFDAWPELWVVRDRDYERALAVLSAAQAGSDDEWHCRRCRESNGAAFEVCWHCGADRYAAGSG